MTFRVKICGITNTSDATAAVAAGADAIGLNFYSRSLRSLTAAEARPISLAARQTAERQQKTVVVVGVFVDMDVPAIVETAAGAELDAIQLHGDQSPDMLAMIRKALDERYRHQSTPTQPNPPRWPLIRALRVGGSSAEEIERQMSPWIQAGVDAILLDSPPNPRKHSRDNPPEDIGEASQAFGGTGHTLAWEPLQTLSRNVPLILAGGLGPDNIGEAIACAQPDGVDVASGVEGLPGKKQLDLVTAFVQQATLAFERLR